MRVIPNPLETSRAPAELTEPRAVSEGTAIAAVTRSITLNHEHPRPAHTHVFVRSVEDFH